MDARTSCATFAGCLNLDANCHYVMLKQGVGVCGWNTNELNELNVGNGKNISRST